MKVKIKETFGNIYYRLIATEKEDEAFLRGIDNKNLEWVHGTYNKGKIEIIEFKISDDLYKKIEMHRESKLSSIKNPYFAGYVDALQWVLDLMDKKEEI